MFPYWIVGILVKTHCCGFASFVNVEYLLRVNRFNHSTYIDDYFYCNALGPSLQWALNGESLIGFRLNEVGRAVVSMGQNYSYTTTLLSSHEIEGQQQGILTSILIVSFEKGRSENFDIICSNSLMINITSTTANPVYAENFENIQTKGDIIALEHVLSGNLIHNSSSLTHILTCGTADRSLTLDINGEGIVFGLRDTIGEAKTEIPDGSSVSRQAILFARQPFETTSVIFVTSNLNIAVTCSFSPHSPAILFVLAKSSDLFSETVTVSSTNSATLSTVKSNDTGTSEFLTSGMLI